MPGFGSIAEVPAAWLAAAALIGCSWVGHRLLSPVHQLVGYRRRVHSSLAAASSLGDRDARSAGMDEAQRLDALSQTRRGFEETATRLDLLASSSSYLLLLYVWYRGYDLKHAAEGLRALSDAIANPLEPQRAAAAAVRAALKLEPEAQALS